MYNLTRYLPSVLMQAAWENGDGIDIQYRKDDTSGRFHYLLRDPHMFDSVDVTSRDKAVGAMQMRSLYLFMKRGPVIIRPSFDLSSALLDTDIRVPCREYKQPFEVVAVELPPDIAGPFYPCLTFVWRPFEQGVMMWTFDRNTGCTYDLMIGDDLPTLEDSFRMGSDDDTDAERRLMIDGTRIALNACMLASHRKIDITPLPEKVARHRRQNDPRLNMLAAREFQEIVYRDLIVKPSRKQDYEPGGGSQGPQRRKAHWRNVACGPKFSQHQMRWINEYETHRESDAPKPTIIYR